MIIINKKSIVPLMIESVLHRQTPNPFSFNELSKAHHLYTNGIISNPPASDGVLCTSVEVKCSRWARGRLKGRIFHLHCLKWNHNVRRRLNNATF